MPIRPDGRPSRRRLGHQPLRHRRVGRGRDASRFYPSGRAIPWQKRIKEVTTKPVLGVGRWTNPDLMIEAINSGGARHHRHLPPVDLRSVPSDQDPRRQARRHPRMHRLQRLHLPLGDRRPAAHLHPERDRGRGVPPRLAPREVRAGEERRQRRPRRRRRAGRDGGRDDPRQARHAPRAPRRGRRTTWADHALDPAAARARRVGPRRQLPQDPDRQAEERRVHPVDDARREGRRRVRRRDRDRRDRLATGRRTASTAARTTRSRGPTRRSRTSSRPTS